jgi:hypothetical protein
MNSLRSRRPPPNLNLIVANPDSEEESSDEERRTAQAHHCQSQQQGSSKMLPQQQQQPQQQQAGQGQGQGVVITAQPPTPGLGGMQGSQSQQRTVDGSSSGSYPMSGGTDRPRTSMEDPNASGMQYRTNASPPPPPPGGTSSAYPPVPPVNRPGSGGSQNQGQSQAQGQGQGPSPSTQLNGNNAHNSNIPSGWPVMMTASNVRPNRHPAMERSLPRIHTPPAYPIPLPPSSGVTARPGDFPSGVPAPQQQQQQQQSQSQAQSHQQHQQQQAQQQAYQALAQKSVGGSIGGSPINTSSPSSPSMTYAGSSVTLPLQPGQPSGGEQTHRRRHEGLPMLPPRPKQQAVPGLVTQAGPSAGSGQSPQRLGSIRLAVTVDNENFSVVDVSGMASAEAIMERVFAKVRNVMDVFGELLAEGCWCFVAVEVPG